MAKNVLEMPWNTIYPLYVAKVERKGRSQADLDAALGWLTGLTPEALHDDPRSLGDFFAAASLPIAAAQITGVVCGVRVEAVSDPLMQRVRYADKLVDELARGKQLTSVIRQ